LSTPAAIYLQFIESICSSDFYGKGLAANYSRETIQAAALGQMFPTAPRNPFLLLSPMFRMAQQEWIKKKKKRDLKHI